MPDIALQTYNQEIKDLIDHGHFDEAIAHCQHILETFPKYVETYRLLAKAFLEQSRHGDAADVFQRVLSVEPDDWLAHVAMAIVREDESNLDMAIWHMERAYEVNPSNTTVQQEIRRLRGKRDGVEPPKLRLTRAALARMYIKGGLFSQAVAEIHSALADDPDRPDLQTLLASALYESGAFQEAADVCNLLLKKLPFSRETNRILGLVLWNTGKQEEAEKFFQRLISLDPYTDTETLKTENRLSTHLVQGILLPKLEWEAQMKTDKTKQPSWAASLGIKIEEPRSSSDKLPDWLNASAAPRSAAPASAAFSGTPDWLGEAVASTGKPSESSSNELPDWLAESANAATGASPYSSPASSTGLDESKPILGSRDAVPDWLNESQTPAAPRESTESAAGQLPAWASASLFGGSDKKPDVHDAPASGASTFSSIPAWGAPTPIQTPAAAIVPAASTVSATPEPAAVPDWIKAATGDSPEAEPAPASNLPDWLSTPPPPQVDALPSSSLGDWAKADNINAPAITGTSQLPDWLSSTRSREQVPEPEPDWIKPLPKSGNEPAVPEWMQGVAPVPQAESIKPEEVPDWLSPQKPAQKTEGIPDWMRSSGPEPTAPAPQTSTPAWMQEEPGAQKNIPDWMKPETAPEPARALKATASQADESGSMQISTPQTAKLTDLPVAPKVEKSSIQEAEIALPPPPFAEPIKAPPSSAIADEPSANGLSDWLKPSASSEAISSTALTEPALSMPDWVAGSSADSGTTAPAASVQPAQAWPDWVTGSATTVAAGDAQPGASVPGAKTEPGLSLPDWLTGNVPLANEAAQSAPEITPSSADNALSLPDWLTGNLSSVSEPVKEPKPDEMPLAQPQLESKAATMVETPAISTAAEPVRPAAVIVAMPRIPAVPEESIAETQKAPAIPMEVMPSVIPVTEQPVASTAPMESVADRPLQTTPLAPAMPQPIQPLARSQSDVSTPPIASTAPATQPAGTPNQPPPENRNVLDVIHAAAPSPVPLPDWLKPAKPISEVAPIQDWETAAQQLNRQPPAASGQTPSTPPVAADLTAPDSQATVDPVARWLDRRLKTSTLRSLDEITAKGKGTTGSLEKSKPGGTGALTPPAPSGASAAKPQIPTWLDFQRPGASDTVVQWIDRRAPATGRLVEDKLQSRSGEKIPTKPLVKSSVTPPVPIPSATETPEWLDRVRRTDAATPPAPEKQSRAEPTAMRSSESPDRVIPQVPLQPSQEFPLASDLPVDKSAPDVPAPSAAVWKGRAAPEPEMEEEDDGSPVPPPEWLQKALGKAVSDVPPIPVTKREQITWEEPDISNAPLTAQKPQVLAKVPKYEQPHAFTPGSRQTELPAQAKRVSTQSLTEGAPTLSGSMTGVPVQKMGRTWQAPAPEEPPPASIVEAGQWMPIAPEKKPAGPVQAKPQAARTGSGKPARAKARKLSVVEAEAMIKEARVYLDTDLEKAAEVYQRVLEVPSCAAAVSNDVQSYLEQDPESAALWNLLGDALSRAGQLPEAYRAYAEALRRMA
jgi:tetratricopeptide (TPR) repeat protein